MKCALNFYIQYSLFVRRGGFEINFYSKHKGIAITRSHTKKHEVTRRNPAVFFDNWQVLISDHNFGYLIVMQLSQDLDNKLLIAPLYKYVIL